MTSAVFLGALALFLRTLAPTFGTDDCPEMALLALNLDVSHPPGYPLYALIGRLFVLLPLGAPAFRMNLLSAFACAGAVALLFATARRLAPAAGRAWPALGALALATSHTWWWQATQSDKYAVGLLLACAFLHSALTAARPARTALLAGLCLSHHPLSVFLMPLALPSVRGVRSARGVAILLFLALLPLSLKPLYTAVRAEANPPSNWGEPRHAAALARYIGVRSYGEKMRVDPGFAVRRTGTHLGFYPHQLGAAGLALAAGATASLAAAFPALAVPLALSFLGTFLFALQFRLEPFLVETYHGLNILLLCLGLAAGFPRLPRRISRRLLLALAAAGTFAHAVTRFHASDSSRSLLLGDFDRAILRYCPPNALLFAGSDYDHFALRYLSQVEGRRGDVRILRLPLSSQRRDYGREVREALGAGQAGNRTLEALIGSAPAGRCVGWTVFSEPFLPVPAVPAGPVLVSARSQCRGTGDWRAVTHRGAFTGSARQPWNRAVLAAEARALELSADRAAAGGDLGGALSLARRAARLSPGASTLTARGIFLDRTGDGLGALESFREASRLDPRALEPYAFALETVRNRGAWRALPGLAESARRGLGIPETAGSGPGESARNLARALAAESARRAEAALTEGDLLKADPRRSRNAEHYMRMTKTLEEYSNK